MSCGSRRACVLWHAEGHLPQVPRNSLLRRQASQPGVAHVVERCDAASVHAEADGLEGAAKAGAGAGGEAAPVEAKDAAGSVGGSAGGGAKDADAQVGDSLHTNVSATLARLTGRATAAEAAEEEQRTRAKAAIKDAAAARADAAAAWQAAAAAEARAQEAAAATQRVAAELQASREELAVIDKLLHGAVLDLTMLTQKVKLGALAGGSTNGHQTRCQLLSPPGSRLPSYGHRRPTNDPAANARHRLGASQPPQ